MKTFRQIREAFYVAPTAAKHLASHGGPGLTQRPLRKNPFGGMSRHQRKNAIIRAAKAKYPNDYAKQLAHAKKLSQDHAAYVITKLAKMALYKSKAA